MLSLRSHESPTQISITTRMHSSRMRTARSLTVSRRILRRPPPQPRIPPGNHARPSGNHAHPPATMHAPSTTMHAPQQPCTPHNHTCPLATTHAPRQPRTPPTHTCTPRQPCMPPSNHARPPSNHARPLPTTHVPPCEQNHTHV